MQKAESSKCWAEDFIYGQQQVCLQVRQPSYLVCNLLLRSGGIAQMKSRYWVRWEKDCTWEHEDHKMRGLRLGEAGKAGKQREAAEGRGGTMMIVEDGGTAHWLKRGWHRMLGRAWAVGRLLATDAAYVHAAKACLELGMRSGDGEQPSRVGLQSGPANQRPYPGYALVLRATRTPLIRPAAAHKAGVTPPAPQLSALPFFHPSSPAPSFPTLVSHRWTAGMACYFRLPPIFLERDPMCCKCLNRPSLDWWFDTGSRS